MTVRYWIYMGLKGGGFSKRMKGIIFDNLAEAEAFVKEQEAKFANAECSIIKKTYGDDEE